MTSPSDPFAPGVGVVPRVHELKKCALRQTKEGTIISFVLHPHEDNEAVITAPIGAVFEVPEWKMTEDAP